MSWAAVAGAVGAIGSAALRQPGAGAQPAGPITNLSGAGGAFSAFDSSGWTVATSGGTATATAGDRGGLASPVTIPPAPGPIVLPDGTVINGTVTPAGAAQLGAYMPFIMLGAGLLVVVVLLKKK